MNTLRDRGVANKIGVSAALVRKLNKQDPSFPEPFRLAGANVVLWDEAEIDVWLARQKQQHRSQHESQ